MFEGTVGDELGEQESLLCVCGWGGVDSSLQISELVGQSGLRMTGVGVR